jgi:hypothetical protein
MEKRDDGASELLSGWTPFAGNRRTSNAGMYWHYTNPEALLGILSSNELWATSPVALNDAAEVEYGRLLMLELLASAREAYTNQELKHLETDSLFQDTRALITVVQFSPPVRGV